MLRGIQGEGMLLMMSSDFNGSVQLPVFGSCTPMFVEPVLLNLKCNALSLLTHCPVFIACSSSG